MKKLIAVVLFTLACGKKEETYKSPPDVVYPPFYVAQKIEPDTLIDSYNNRCVVSNPILFARTLVGDTVRTACKQKSRNLR